MSSNITIISIKKDYHWAKYIIKIEHNNNTYKGYYIESNLSDPINFFENVRRCGSISWKESNLYSFKYGQIKVEIPMANISSTYSGNTRIHSYVQPPREIVYQTHQPQLYANIGGWEFPIQPNMVITMPISYNRSNNFDIEKYTPYHPAPKIFKKK